MRVNKFVPMVGFCAVSLLSSSVLAHKHELWAVNCVTQKCLDATTKDPNGKVQATKCDINLKAEQWIVNQPKKENIQNAYKGFGYLCLDMIRTVDGFPVVTNRCQSYLKAQTWTFPPKGQLGQIENGYYSGRCLKVAADNTVISVGCNPKDLSQAWKFVSPGESTQCEAAPVKTTSVTVKPICSFAPPPGPCTADRNECGYPSQCECPVLYAYNPATGNCDLSFNANGKPAPAAAAKAAKGAKIAQTICSFAPPDNSICTADLNICGNPSICTCPLRYEYNPATETCDLSEPF